MKPSDNQIYEFIHQNRPDFEPVNEPEKLHGGNLNFVWRVQGKSESLIVKHAPPHIASNPDIPLNPNRLEFEAYALRLFLPDNNFSDLSTDDVQPPAIYGFDNSRYLLLMEDISPAQPWFRSVRNGLIHPPGSATHLGEFIGNLHRETYRDKKIAEIFSNRAIQQTRLTVQYHSAKESLTKAGFKNVAHASNNAVKLGEKLLNPGKCLIMGDLWPPSVLVQHDKLRLIDWEFSHFGRPLQDLAHLGAHCYMHSLFSDSNSDVFKTIWTNFLDGYREGAKDTYKSLLDEDELKWLPIHFGAEILVRAGGPFSKGYLFSDLPEQSPQLQAALQKSYTMLNNTDEGIHPEELF